MGLFSFASTQQSPEIKLQAYSVVRYGCSVSFDRKSMQLPISLLLSLCRACLLSFPRYNDLLVGNLHLFGVLSLSRFKLSLGVFPGVPDDKDLTIIIFESVPACDKRTDQTDRLRAQLSPLLSWALPQLTKS